jgi:hypothetical protein
MNIQNQINLVLAYINANLYGPVSRIEISKDDCVYVFVKSENPTYYTVHSIWQDDEFEMFTDADIEDALQNGRALSMLSNIDNCPVS